MAAALAQREKEKRGLQNVEILTGGTNPADHVHPKVVEVMQEEGIDLSNRVPQKLGREEIKQCDYVITMGCGVEDACPANWSGKAIDWKLQDPGEQDIDTVRTIRDDVKQRVSEFFDDIGSK